MMNPHIAIIGAGPAGLVLARILQHNGIQCTIFEVDKDRFARDQGGIVDLHPQSGQIALREAGLLEEFQKRSLPAAEAMKLIKSDGTICWDENNMKVLVDGHSRDRPEIDRGVLRDMLLNSVDLDSIHWNKKVIRVVPSDTFENKYNIEFVDGVQTNFDLVIGGDGAWSKVRSLLTDQQPFYSGITIIELKAQEVSKRKQWLSDYTGHGSCFMFDEGRALVCQQNGSDSIRIYAGVRQPETWLKDCDIDWEKPDIARALLAERYFGGCHVDIRRLISVEASDGLIPRSLYMLPIGFRWRGRPGVTLLGDAAHLMTPFAGVGVNVAMADALDLAKALLKRKEAFKDDLSGNIGEALQEYETLMFERAKENMGKSWMGLQNHFSSSGIDERVKRLRHRAEQIEERRKLDKRE